MFLFWLCALVSLYLTPSQATKSACKSNPLDIAIVIDRTRSVGMRNYKIMLNSVKKLVSMYEVGEDNTHFSIVTFAGNAEVRVSLNDPKYHSQEALQTLLDKMKKKDKLSAPTRTDRALEIVNDKVFVAENGDRPESPNIMVIFTDGGTSRKSDSYGPVLKALEKKGVHRIAVGIGKKIRQSELETIAGHPGRVVRADDFKELNDKLEKIHKATCSIDGGYTEWSEWSACYLTCGGGVRVRLRSCTNPSPKNGGLTCIEQNLGQHEETETCNTNKCPPCAPESPPTPCVENLDVVVVIDSSASIKSDNYNIARAYVVEIVERLGISDAGTHLGIILYSHEAHTWHRFTDEQTVAAVSKKANALPYIAAGTRTDKALELAAEEFFGSVESGDRPDVPNVMIVLTDGHTNVGSKPYSDVTPPLNDASVRRIAIGIGKGVGVHELRQIASSDHGVLSVSSYDDLHSILEDILTLSCENQVPGHCDSWGSYGDCSKTCGGGVQSRSRICPDDSLHLRKQNRRCSTDLCPGQQPCEDLDETCPLSAASGLCFKNRTIIHGILTFTLWENCPKSCRRCNVDPACQDIDPYNCPRYSGNSGGTCILSEDISNKIGRHIPKTTPKIDGGYDVNELCQKTCNHCSVAKGF